MLVSAHKLILKHASDVFEAMFRFDAKKEKAEFASANCPVEVPDVEAAAFKVMLSFIYTEELSELNGDNSMEVLYAVPSGVLTTDEVIGVEKYNSQPNFDRISKQCMLHFQCQEQIWTDGTLLMDIEKMSEFAQEFIGSYRRSETVQIKGFPLQILAQLSPKNGNIYNEKWLAIFLVCDVKEDKKWSCKCSVTVRIE
ncbi:hypothetical protein niasHT_014524 [Heterodera trifolii]|uniref:BTB domain-containing protein n=1 Tax=Heterodera trifolii TaxID=157864 RepID=A0ABD2KZH4_9BILA